MSSISADFCRRLGGSLYLKDEALYLGWTKLSELQAVSPSQSHLAKLLAASLGANKVHLCTQVVREKEVDSAFRGIWKIEASFIRKQEKWHVLDKEKPQ